MTYILQAYDDALRNIIKNGVWKENRTGVRTVAVFGIQSRYRINEHFPLLTGRKVWPKAIFGELLWFLSGSTNNNDLIALGSGIWTPWVDHDFEKKHGFIPGSFGPVYGFQLRHFGGEYGDGDKEFTVTECDQDFKVKYGAGGFDQLANMVKTLKENPDDRRNLFSLWNPLDTWKMRLPPCHYTFQCFVHDGKLSGMLTQRSCDFPVGIPANIQFYSALIYMLAQQCDLEPYEFIHSTADSHIYEDQIPAVEEYLARPKPDSPKLILHKADDIYSYQMSDFEIVDYNPQAAIKIPVAV
ncbi:MAG: thymidylate synthase [Proteobacteria bacterium]|jgi:thymidylate synthase|nr:thymidylate synthase [Pseudomonadota bacterium]